MTSRSPRDCGKITRARTCSIWHRKYAYGLNEHDVRMRRAVWRALTRRFGHGMRIGRGALVTHPETFEIGDGVFIGEQAFIQGRFDGRCVIGDHTWIGPQSYFDARDLVIEEYVGWGPGAKVLGSRHTGVPLDVPIIQTDLEIRAGAHLRLGRHRRQRRHAARRHDRPGRYRRRRMLS